MNTRRSAGRETWHRLLEWDRGQPESERLAARLLGQEGYEEIDPSHPLGGRDGGKDIICEKNGQKYVIAVYFPRGYVSLGELKKKFRGDTKKIKASGHKAAILFTNQELKLSEREALIKMCEPLVAEVYHLERISAALDSPKGYGLRLEFLSIEMTKEEQISYFSDRDQILHQICETVSQLAMPKPTLGKIKTVSVQGDSVLAQVAYPFGSKLVECIGCKEVFRATRNPMAAALFVGVLETVACPACGKVQAYR